GSVAARGADPHADLREARPRPGALRAGDGAEPDDRPPAPADGHGALRALARRQTFIRAHYNRHPAVAGAALRDADPLHLRAGGGALAAAAVLLRTAHAASC